MATIIGLLDMVTSALRTGFNYVLLLSLVAATVAWLVRSRRVNAFGGLARFSRSVLDPLIEPIEQRVVRAGGTSASAPWWALVFVLLAGVVVLFVLRFVRDILWGLYAATTRGAGGIVPLLVGWAFGILQLAIIVRVITSWVGGSHTAVGRFAHLLTEWFLRPLRSVIPAFGGIDLSPLIAWFALSLLQGMVFKAL